MKVYSQGLIERNDLEELALIMGIEIHNYRPLSMRSRGRYAGILSHQFTIRPGEQRYMWRMQRPGQGTWAVSWAGHYVFMRCLFHMDSAAIIETALYGDRRWNGVEDFMQRAPATANTNIGSIIDPLEHREGEHVEHFYWSDIADLEAMARRYAIEMHKEDVNA